MTPTELTLSENPARALFEQLGYVYIPASTLHLDRDSERDAVLPRRLVPSLRRLNPWLSLDDAKKVARQLISLPSTSLIEASEAAHTRLTYGTTVEQDGEPSRDVRFFDFDDFDNNDFVITTQLAFRGSKKTIKPDLVAYVNGIPLAVIECKSPTIGESWKEEAIDQLHRYQEVDERYREQGAPKLFETVQLVVATCGQASVYGTVTTPYRFFAEWKSPWPLSEGELRTMLGREPWPQDIALAGLFAKESLLDIVRNFVVFERDGGSKRMVRKVCRYQQFRAVNKAIQRARAATRSGERGGVVWHTQGSGKSLTMLWLALKLRRESAFDNPLLVIVTDRKDLDDQIRKTFQNCGFPHPERAESVRDLRSLLSGPSGRTVLTTVQKFQEAAEGKGTKKKGKGDVPVLSDASNVFVLTDEAHRSQYGSLAARMRASLPNASFFGFTGTPIDKNDRSTLQTFGSYIDTYTIEQAVADGATVPIFYEARLAELRVLGAALDSLFERVFADRSEEEREAIKKKYGSEDAIATAPKRVEAIALDIIEHYTTYIEPNGFKAQVVASSRAAAVRYKEALDKLNGPESAVIMSGSNDDPKALADHHKTEPERRALIDRFLDKDDPLKILVVCDMLLTGFDAPIEQVMYLDKPLREHTLLQAIARVNRTADKKTFGLIVDYFGVSEALTEALSIFAPKDVQGAMRPKVDELPRLVVHHREAKAFFEGVAKRGELLACVRILEDAEVRGRFNEAFKRFAKSLDMLLPDPRALRFVQDAKWLGAIRQTAAARFRDDKIDIGDCGAKVRKLIEEAIAVDGVAILVKEVSLFSPDFEEKLAALKTDDARAGEAGEAIRHEIAKKRDEDPAFYTSLKERLERIIEERKAKRIDAAKQLELFRELREEMRGHGEAAAKAGMSEAAFAIYGLLTGGPQLKTAERKGAAYGTIDTSKRELAGILEELLEPQVTIVDWPQKDDVKRTMRRGIKRQLRAAGYDSERLDSVAEAIVALMRGRRG